MNSVTVRATSSILEFRSSSLSYRSVSLSYASVDGDGMVDEEESAGGKSSQDL